MITTGPDGSTMITGVHVELYRLTMWKFSIKLEIAGLHHSSGRSVSAVAAEYLKLPKRTPKKVVLEKLVEHIEKWKAEHPNV